MDFSVKRRTKVEEIRDAETRCEENVRRGLILCSRQFLLVCVRSCVRACVCFCASFFKFNP